MIRDENGMLAGYVFVDLATSDIGGYVEQAKEIVREKLTLPAGYSLVWSGQYENMLRVRERLKIVVPDHAVPDLRPALHEYQIDVESDDRHAGRSLLPDRRRLAHVDPRLQHLDRRLGRHDRADGSGRGDRRLHAPLSGPLLRRGQAQRAAEKQGRADRGDHSRRGQTGPAQDDDGDGRLHGPDADHVVDRDRRGHDETRGRPMVGGLATSFVLELLVYPAIYYLWKWRTEVRHLANAIPEGGILP